MNTNFLLHYKQNNLILFIFFEMNKSLIIFYFKSKNIKIKLKIAIIYPKN